MTTNTQKKQSKGWVVESIKVLTMAAISIFSLGKLMHLRPARLHASNIASDNDERDDIPVIRVSESEQTLGLLPGALNTQQDNIEALAEVSETQVEQNTASFEQNQPLPRQLDETVDANYEFWKLQIK